ncbi:MAG: CHAT domain-containing protein [Chloroflexota bacterium]|nr:MAG: CHAT domain-containing protein [Chloroflexota bacterium]
MVTEELAQQLSQTHSADEAQRLLEESKTALDASIVHLLKSQSDFYGPSDAYRALALAEAALRVSSLLSDPRCLALSMRAKANALRRLGDHEAALGLLEESARLYQQQGEVAEAARTRIGKVAALMFLSRYDEALQEAREARRVLARQGELQDTAKLDANTGSIYHRLGRYDEALKWYGRARRIFNRLGAELSIAQVDVNRATALAEYNGFRRALEGYQRARLVYERHGMSATVAMIDANLGFLYHTQGRYNRALEMLLKARDAFEELGLPKDAAVASLDLADLYLSLNLFDEAIELCSSAKDSFDQQGVRYEAARALAIKAMAQSQLGYDAGAMDSFTAAQEIFRQEGNEIWIATIDLHKAVLLYRSGTARPAMNDALRSAQAAEKLFAEKGLPAKQSNAQLIEGRIREALGQTEQANELYDRALHVAAEFELPWLVFQCHHAKAGLEQDTAPDKAKASLRKAIDSLERMRSDLQPEELKMAFLRNRLQVYEDAVLLSLDGGGDRGLSEAFSYVERAKSRALLDLLSRGLTSDQQHAPGGQRRLAQRMYTLREEISWYYNKLNEPSAHRRPEQAEDLRKITEEIRRREKEISEIAQRLSVGDEQYVPLHDVRVRSIESTQQALGSDTTLVEYYIANDEIMAFVVDRDRPRVYRHLASEQEVAATAGKLRFHLGKFGYGPKYVRTHLRQLQAIVDDHLERLREDLISPIVDQLHTSRLVIVPHGLLHYVPFHALCDAGHYLIEDFELSYSPSATLLDYCGSKNSGKLLRPLLVGVPDEKAPLVAGEVTGIAQLFPSSTTLLGEAATAAAVRTLAPTCDLLHIASHAVFRQDNPMFSRLKLSDAWLSVYDIYDLRLQCSLVTLSACETGMNRIAAGDELIGLARGFFYAGSPSIVVSLWAVNDSSTAELMQRFYAGLKEGLSRSAALRQAQLATKDEHRHPYYWAPFVLLGQS